MSTDNTLLSKLQDPAFQALLDRTLSQMPYGYTARPMPIQELLPTTATKLLRFAHDLETLANQLSTLQLECLRIVERARQLAQAGLTLNGMIASEKSSTSKPRSVQPHAPSSKPSTPRVARVVRTSARSRRLSSLAGELLPKRRARRYKTPPVVYLIRKLQEERAKQSAASRFSTRLPIRKVKRGPTKRPKK